jgi:hypothetical protein
MSSSPRVYPIHTLSINHELSSFNVGISKIPRGVSRIPRRRSTISIDTIMLCLIKTLKEFNFVKHVVYTGSQIYVDCVIDYDTYNNYPNYRILDKVCKIFTQGVPMLHPFIWKISCIAHEFTESGAEQFMSLRNISWCEMFSSYWHPSLPNHYIFIIDFSKN